MTKLTDLSNVDAEVEVLSMVFIKQDAMLDISRELTGKDFSRQSNQILFEKLKMMAAAGEHINLITVTEGMRKDGTLEKVGGLSYLAYINQKTFTTAGLQEDIRVIKEYSQRREMLRFSHDLDNAAGDMTRDVDEIAAWI
jgi:replicative DNA helicase